MLRREARDFGEALAAAGNDRHGVSAALQNDLREKHDGREPNSRRELSFDVPNAKKWSR